MKTPDRLTDETFEKVCEILGGRYIHRTDNICVAPAAHGNIYLKFVDRRDYEGNVYFEFEHNSRNNDFDHSIHGYFKECYVTSLGDKEARIVCRTLDYGNDETIARGNIEIHIHDGAIDYSATSNATGRVDLK